MKLKRFIASVVATALVGTTMAVASATTVSADTIGHAWLLMQDGDPSQGAGVSNWEMSDSAGYIDITGNGSYTISFDIPEGCGAEQIDFLGISTDINVYQQDATEQELYNEMTFDINSIVIDGVDVAYNGPSGGANGTNDDGSTFRLSIYDTWSGRGVTDIDNVVSCATNITINFTVNGIKDAQTPGEDNTGSEETTKADETTKSGDTTTKSDGTTKAGETTKSNGSSTEVAQEETTTATGDTGVAGIVLVCALTGAGVVATRKKD